MTLINICVLQAQIQLQSFETEPDLSYAFIIIAHQPLFPVKPKETRRSSCSLRLEKALDTEDL
jgi:hypothetical protein